MKTNTGTYIFVNVHTIQFYKKIYTYVYRRFGNSKFILKKIKNKKSLKYDKLRD